MMQVSGLSGQASLLRAVHAQPGITRVSAAQELEMPSGFAAETSARLAALELLIEHPAPPTGRRGRPTTSLHPHPCGPLVAVADIAHESWRVAAVQLGGEAVESVKRPHQRDQAEVLAAVAGELDSFGRRYGGRIRAVAVAVPGTVVGGRLVQAPNLGWNDVDLSMLWPRYDPQCPFLTGNDATFAAIAESRRGAAAGAGTILHLYMDAGVGGAVIEGGRALLGATGMAGEFGHMPFGDPTLRCRCGAAGCWNTTLDGHAVARALRQPAPADEVTYTRRIIAAAKAHQPEELSAIQAAARDNCLAVPAPCVSCRVPKPHECAIAPVATGAMAHSPRSRLAYGRGIGSLMQPADDVFVGAVGAVGLRPNRTRRRVRLF